MAGVCVLGNDIKPIERAKKVTTPTAMIDTDHLGGLRMEWDVGGGVEERLN